DIPRFTSTSLCRVAFSNIPRAIVSNARGWRWRAARAPRGRLSVARGPRYVDRSQLTRKRRTLSSKLGQRALTMRTLTVVFVALRRPSPPFYLPPLYLPPYLTAASPRRRITSPPLHLAAASPTVSSPPPRPAP